jgi:hypothetical protein
MQGGSALQAAAGMAAAEEPEVEGSEGKGIKRKLDLGDC